MTTSQKRQDEDTQKAQGQGRVAAGGYDDQGHPLTRDGHVDHRTERGHDDSDMDDNRSNNASRSHSQPSAHNEKPHADNRRHSNDDSSQGHVGAGGYDDDGNPLTKDGHVDKRVKSAR